MRQQLNLYLKPGLMVSAKFGRFPDPFNLAVRGWKMGKYIVLDHPLQDRHNLARIAPEEPCRIRYISEGLVITFATHGLAVMKDPMDLIVIEYPKTLTTKTSLKKFRPTKTAITTNIKINDDAHKGVIWDLSIGGIQFATNVDLAVGQVASFDFEFFSGRQFQGIQAKIKNRKVELKSIEFPYLYGCEFLELSMDDKKSIQYFLEYCFKKWESIRKEELAKRKQAGPNSKKTSIFS